MGGYAAYVWPSFAMSALVLGWLVLASQRAFRRAERALATLEQGQPSPAARRNAGAP
ncbi:MAG: heme exporter protein CcmD [Proteobacteria bacterium]|nr:heme exporter protein CcmD [Pseudomonadota bacterium]